MLTILIPCKDEQDNIRACVESARMLGGEILVADSGSTDDTLEIVRGMPDCRLIEREFVNYADFKNWAIPQAANPWVLILDADERVTPQLAAEIKSLLASPPASIDAYWIPRRTFFFGREVRFGPWLHDGADRLIRRDLCRYGQCRVHEGLIVDRRRRARLRGKLLHHTIDSYEEYFSKYLHYTRWGAEDSWENGRRASSWSMLARPMLRFLLLYVFRGGFLDGAVGIQTCMLQAFFVTFVKQGRLWELQHRRADANPAAAHKNPGTIPPAKGRPKPAALAGAHRVNSYAATTSGI